MIGEMEVPEVAVLFSRRERTVKVRFADIELTLQSDLARKLGDALLCAARSAEAPFGRAQ
jgi:hypothetical protein